MKNASVRFYFDADILGLAHVVCSLRPDCTFPGDPGQTIKRQVRQPCEISQGAKDSEWIPAVAERGWIALTRDADIQSHLSLLQLVQEHGLRLVTLTSEDARTPWGQLEVVMSNWRRIEELYDRRGPLVIAAARTSLRHIDVNAAIDKVRKGRSATRRGGRRQTEELRLF
ncbi:hypothetical protein [Mycolicibacter heraklionensis]|uniref:PIN-like domain-containing protein n=1 Tax=Mycolicibacter heraklionensis TaxID=512402 RepID=UPI0007EBBE41